jgi:hypothetical protein
VQPNANCRATCHNLSEEHAGQRPQSWNMFYFIITGFSKFRFAVDWFVRRRLDPVNKSSDKWLGIIAQIKIVVQFPSQYRQVDAEKYIDCVVKSTHDNCAETKEDKTP